MSRKTRRAAIFAAAATLLFAFVGVDGSGAYAQDSELQITGEVRSSAEARDSSADTSQVRFVAHEVVQDLPTEASDTDEGVASIEADSLSALVAAMATGTELSDDMRCLAQAIYFEARGEPLAGQLAVGRVVINRAESEAFPDTYCGVVKQRAQFSFVKRGRIPAVKKSSAAWRRAKAIARIAHRELWESPAHDALFFHATYVRPSWASRKVASATIDSHVFYR